MEPDDNRDRTAAEQSTDFAAQDMASMLEWVAGPGQEHRAYQAIEKGDYDEARRLLEPVAARGSTYSLLTLAWLYEGAKLGPADMNVAISYYERAASEGSAEAHRRLGRLLYDLGEEEKARAAFEHGSQAGIITCMYWLGKMMLEGRGGPIEVNRGTELLETAAAQGHMFAKRRLLEIERLKAGSIFRKLVIQGRIIALAKDVFKETWKDPASDKIY